MKDFKELKETKQQTHENNTMKDFAEVIEESRPLLEGEMVSHLSKEELQEATDVYIKLMEHLQNGGTVEELDEGTLSSIVGGVAGFLAGPALGKAIAKALGIEKGIMYDMLTSRLVTAALGASIFKGKK